MAAIITVSDLPTEIRSAELIQTMVSGANAKASRVAPCLASVETPRTLESHAHGGGSQR